MNHWDDLERKVRERAVRVDERLRLINGLRNFAGAEENVILQRENMLDAVRTLADRLRDEVQ